MNFKNDSSSRRKVLKATGIALGASAVPSVTASGSSREGERPRLADFAVKGTKRKQISFSPGTITVETTYSSPDLGDRKGRRSSTFSESLEYDRDEFADDEFPRRGVETTVEPWETFVASEDQWRAYHQSHRTVTYHEGRRATTNNVSTQHDHEPEEDDRCGIAVWNYAKDDDGDYHVKSPINYICWGFDVTDVGDVFENAGWTGNVNEHDRYAWDVDRETFVGPDQQEYNEYGSWATSTYRISGGYHARCYELEDGIVSLQVHEDDELYTGGGHSVESYESAKNETDGIFLSESDVDPYGSLYLDNEKFDHTGYAWRVESDRDSINRSC